VRCEGSADGGGVGGLGVGFSGKGADLDEVWAKTQLSAPGAGAVDVVSSVRSSRSLLRVVDPPFDSG